MLPPLSEYELLIYTLPDRFLIEEIEHGLLPT